MRGLRDHGLEQMNQELVIFLCNGLYISVMAWKRGCNITDMYQYITSLNIVFVSDSCHVISLPRGQYLAICIKADRLPKSLFILNVYTNNVLLSFSIVISLYYYINHLRRQSTEISSVGFSDPTNFSLLTDF